MIHPDHMDTLRRRREALVENLASMERAEEGLGAGFTKQQLVIAITAAQAELNALSCALAALCGAEETLKFYGEAISYAPTQVREPRTAVHGDAGRRARDTLEAAQCLNPTRVDHHGNPYRVVEEECA